MKIQNDINSTNTDKILNLNKNATNTVYERPIYLLYISLYNTIKMQYNFEWTTQNFQESYQNYMANIIKYYNEGSSSISPNTVEQSFSNILNLLIEGQNKPISEYYEEGAIHPDIIGEDSNDSIKYYSEKGLLNGFDSLVFSFEKHGIVNFNDYNVNFNTQNLNAWASDPLTTNVMNIIVLTTDATNPLEEIISVDFIYSMNLLINDKFNQINQVFLSNVSSLDLLSDIQRLKNTYSILEKEVPPPANTAESFNQYESLGKEYWDTPVIIQPHESSGQNQLENYKIELLKEIIQLEEYGQDRYEEGSLANTLWIVYNDMRVGYFDWVIDNSGGSPTNTNSPDIFTYQDNITKAIDASSSLNLQTKEAISAYMYLFEEYYKQAAKMLGSLTRNVSSILNHMQG